jgi:hypothetical protein
VLTFCQLALPAYGEPVGFKDRKIVRMLKELMRRRNKCLAEGTLLKTGGAYEKAVLVPVAPVGC